MSEDTASFESPEDAGPGKKGVVRLWLSALDAADREEQDWRSEAQGVVETPGA